jgi:hypothetical protein
LGDVRTVIVPAVAVFIITSLDAREASRPRIMETLRNLAVGLIR